MRVGILGGTGPLGRGLGLRLAAAGASVVIGSRRADRAREVASELAQSWPAIEEDVSGAGNDAAASCELVVLATPWDAALSTAQELAPQLAGKVVICVANALVKQGREMHALIPARGSVAASVQGTVPAARVVAACHHLPAATLADLEAPLLADVLVCADDEDAKDTTMGLITAIDGLRPLDAGSLASAGAVEAFTAVLVTLNIRYKAHSTLHLAGLEERA